jgi:hypothetical protein
MRRRRRRGFGASERGRGTADWTTLVGVFALGFALTLLAIRYPLEELVGWVETQVVAVTTW